MGSDSPSYQVAAADQGKQLRVLVTYVDGDAFPEAITLSVGIIPPTPGLLPVIAFEGDPVSALEGNSGFTTLTVSVRRTGNLSEESHVFWSVVGSGPDPASAADFDGGTLPSGTLAFAPGEEWRQLSVLVAADPLPEADEAFLLTLSEPAGALLDAGAQTIHATIRNDDARPPAASLPLLIHPLAPQMLVLGQWFSLVLPSYTFLERG